MTHTVTTLSRKELVVNLEGLVRREKRTTLEILLCLAEVERRRIHVELGYQSLFSYLTSGFGYSEGAAMRRITASRAIRKFPGVEKYLREGKLNLTTISLISSILSEDNCGEVLECVSGKSKVEVERIVCGYRPARQTQVREEIRIVRVKESQPNPEIQTNSKNIRGGAKLEVAEKVAREKGEEERLKFVFSTDTDFGKKVDEARVLMSGKFPRGARLEQIFSEMLEFYLEKHRPSEKKQALRKKEQPERQTKPAVKQSAPSSRHIPAAVRREVMSRDNYCCTYVSPEGKRCGSTWQLQVDHIVPWAKGGTHEVSGLRVLCATHNKLMAERHFGGEFMAKFSPKSDFVTRV